MAQTAAEVWRKYVTDGVPGSGINQPDKTQIIAWGTLLESLLSGAGAGLAYATRALLFADLAHTANTTAVVYADSTAAYNGTYAKAGISGAGSWARIGDSQNGVIALTVTGGTGNAIVATAPETPTVPGAKLYLLTVSSSNTGATTIAVNGGSAAPIKDAFGSALASGSLVAGTQAIMAWSVDHYQLLISAVVDGSAILADAVAARDAAIAAAALVTTNARFKLTSDLTRYVRKDGSDANAGTANTSGGAWLTIAHAISVITSTFDFGGFSVTIQVGDGTYAENLQLLPYVGRGGQGHTTPVIQGNASNSSAVIIDGDAGPWAVLGVETAGFEWVLKNLKVKCVAGAGVYADRGSWICIDNIVFGSCVNHLLSNGGFLEVLNNYSIVGDFTNHMVIQNQGCLAYIIAPTITIVGTPAMSGYFSYINFQAQVSWALGVNFVGSVTGGAKYFIDFGGGSNTGGHGMNSFPGAAAGTLNSPGWIA